MIGQFSSTQCGCANRVQDSIAAVFGVDQVLQADDKSVLFVTNTFEYGGAEKHLLDLIRRLAKRGAQVSILCLDSDFYSERLNDNRVRVISGKGELRSFLEWFHLFRRLRPDVVVFIRAYLWCYDWYVPVAAWLAGIQRRVTIAHLPPPEVPVWGEESSIASIISRLRRAVRLFKLRISVASECLYVCVSNAIRDALIRGYQFPSKKTITIYNGVSLAEMGGDRGNGIGLRMRLGIDSAEFLLLCVARLSEQKRVDILLLAMAKVLREGVKCKCVIVGNGPLRDDLVKLASAEGLSEHVMFEGFQADVRPYLEAATAFALTSDKEGFPLSILEAMAYGLPCIVTNVGGNAEAVEQGVHGLVVRPGSVDDLAEAIAYFVKHPDDLKRMSGMTRARVCREFDIEKRMTQMNDAILGRSSLD